MKFKLVADSCCELTDVLKEKLGAESVALSMNFGEDVYVDDENLDLNLFLSEMKKYKGCPKSACPAPIAFANKCMDATTFVVTISSQLSGSYTSAMIGKDIAEEDGADVHVFDSKSASAGEILISMKILECVEAGMGKAEIVQTVEAFIKEMRTFFVLENLDNLIKNGRMSKITGKIASVMHIRPILGADEDGNIASYSKAKGTKQALEKLGDMIGEFCENTAGRTLVITHCNNEPSAFRLRDMAKNLYSFKEIIVVPMRGLSSMYANEGGIIMAF